MFSLYTYLLESLLPKRFKRALCVWKDADSDLDKLASRSPGMILTYVVNSYTQHSIEFLPILMLIIPILYMHMGRITYGMVILFCFFTCNETYDHCVYNYIYMDLIYVYIHL